MTADDRRALIEHMLCEVEMNLKDSNEFIEALRSWFNARTNLTDNQLVGLRKLYERI